MVAEPSAELVRQVRSWIIDGNKEENILEAIAAQNESAEADRVIERAIDEIVEAGKVSREFAYGWCLESYRELYRRMVDVGDFAGALKAVKHIQDLTQ